jgi:hypothetical protein
VLVDGDKILFGWEKGGQVRVKSRQNHGKSWREKGTSVERMENSGSKFIWPLESPAE